MMIKNKFVICSVLIVIVILTACIFSTGCTSAQSTHTPAQNSFPTVTAPVINPTTTPETIVTTFAPTTASPTAISTTAPPVNGITVSLNSAVKKINIGNFNNKPGNIFLVLDVTIQNNDKNNEFKYTDSSFAIGDKTNKNRRTAITSQVAGGLNNPLSSGSIPLKSTKTGQIVFGVMENSTSYRLFVADPTGTLLASIDNIEVP